MYGEITPLFIPWLSCLLDSGRCFRLKRLVFGTIEHLVWPSCWCMCRSYLQTVLPRGCMSFVAETGACIYDAPSLCEQQLLIEVADVSLVLLSNKRWQGFLLQVERGSFHLFHAS